MEAESRLPVDRCTGFLIVSAIMLAFFHVSPWAIEPPSDVVVPYAKPVLDYHAFGSLLTLIAAVSVGVVYASVLWYRGRLRPTTLAYRGHSPKAMCPDGR